MKFYQVLIVDKGLEQDDPESYSRSATYIVHSSVEKALIAVGEDLDEIYVHRIGDLPVEGQDTTKEWIAEITGTLTDQAQSLETGQVGEISYEDDEIFVQINVVGVDEYPLKPNTPLGKKEG